MDMILSFRRGRIAFGPFTLITERKTQGQVPLSVTLDGYAASHRAVREMPVEDMIWKDTKRRSWKYPNNMIERDHRGVKSRITPMLGFKIFKRAAVTISGIELLRRIRKGQFALDRLDVQSCTQSRNRAFRRPGPAAARSGHARHFTFHCNSLLLLMSNYPEHEVNTVFF
jgi:transposase-like protein